MYVYIYIQYCAKVLGTQSKMSLHDIAAQAGKKELQWSFTWCNHDEKQLLRQNAESLTQQACLLHLDQQAQVTQQYRLFDSSRCLHGLLFNLFLTSSQGYSMRFRSEIFYIHGLINISFHQALFSVTWCPILQEDNISTTKPSHIF